MKKVLPALIVIVAILIGVSLYQKYRIAPAVDFETLQLTDLNNQPVNLKETYAGKKIFLNFFATWCGSCLGEFPSLDKAAETLIPDNFVFISISDEPIALLNKASSRLGLQHIIILHSVKRFKELNIFTYPTSYLLNAKGQVVFKKTQEANWNEPEIIALLKQKAD